MEALSVWENASEDASMNARMNRLRLIGLFLKKFCMIGSASQDC
jgi:hypothetical protein